MNEPKLSEEPAVNAGVDQAFEILTKLFDAFVIMGTYLDEDGRTKHVCRGHGNEFSINGIVAEYIKREDIAMMAEAVVDEMDARDGKEDDTTE